MQNEVRLSQRHKQGVLETQKEETFLAHYRTTDQKKKQQSEEDPGHLGTVASVKADILDKGTLWSESKKRRGPSMSQSETESQGLGPCGSRHLEKNPRHLAPCEYKKGQEHPLKAPALHQMC